MMSAAYIAITVAMLNSNQNAIGDDWPTPVLVIVLLIYAACMGVLGLVAWRILSDR